MAEGEAVAPEEEPPGPSEEQAVPSAVEVTAEWLGVEPTKMKRVRSLFAEVS